MEEFAVDTEASSLLTFWLSALQFLEGSLRSQVQGEFVTYFVATRVY